MRILHKESDAKFMTKCQEFQSEKTYKKPLDKRKRKCYNMQAVNERRAKASHETAGCQRGAHTSGAKDRRMDERIGKQHDRKSRKKLKKLLKNLLTKSRRCDIMSKHFRRAGKRLRKELEKNSKNFSKTP